MFAHASMFLYLFPRLITKYRLLHKGVYYTLTGDFYIPIIKVFISLEIIYI